MDGDAWGGVVFCVGGVGVALFFVWALLSEPKRRVRKNLAPMSMSAKVGVSLFSVASAGFGVGMLFVLTLSARPSEHVTVEGKYFASSFRTAGARYEVVTTRGIFEASTPSVYDELVVGRSYDCRVRDTGYYGPPSATELQSTLEACHATA